MSENIGGDDLFSIDVHLNISKDVFVLFL